MKNIMNSFVQKLRAGRRKAHRATALLLALAMLGTMWCPGNFVALAAETCCGLEEHTHTDDCYEQVLVCGQEEGEDHTHTDDCYETQLVCGLEEHTHTDSCYSAAADSSASGEQSSDEADSSASGEQSNKNADVSAAALDEEDEEDEDDSDSSTDEGSVGVSALESSAEAVLYTFTSCTYDTDTGNFNVSVALEFIFNQDNITSDYYKASFDTSIVTTEGYTVAYEIALPDDFVVPSSLIGYSYDGFDADYKKQFEYYFVENTDNEGNVTYSVVLVFSESYIASLDSEDVTFSGTLNFSGSVDESCYNTTSGDINIPYGVNNALTATIYKEQITWASNETINEDINVKKTASYDADAGTLTYTITVYSEKGTDTITLTDYFSSSSGLKSILGNMTSITYQSATITDSTTTLTGNSSTLKKGSEGSSNYPYYYYDSSGKMIIVLDSLDAAESGTDANAWVITYTYEVTDLEQGVSYSGTNNVTADTEDEVADTDISKSANYTARITGTSLLKKSGSYSESSNSITWTITVGDGTEDLSDYVLTDEMLAEMTSGSLTIKDATTNYPYTPLSASSIIYAVEAASSTYTYYSDASLTTEVSVTDPTAYPVVILCDDNGDIQSITFNSGTKYTITYTTETESAWSDTTVTNEAELTYEGTNTDQQGDGYVSEGSATVTGTASSSFSKSFSSATEDASDDSLYTLTWSASFTVPSSGIPAGTTFADYTYTWNSYISHSITYEQAQAIITELKTTWGEENITNIQFNTSYSSSTSIASGWVDADSISSTKTYYRFRFTIANEVAYYDSETMTLTQAEQDSLTTNGYFTRTTNGVTKVYYQNNALSFTYSTTATTSTSSSDSFTYYNYLTDGSSTKSDSKTIYKKVKKYGTDASGTTTSSSSSNSVTVTDDTLPVTWVVRVMTDGSSSYTITDKLPAGVTLTEVYAYTSNSASSVNTSYQQLTVDTSNGTTTYTTLTDGTYSCTVTQDKNNTEEDLSDDVQTVTITAPSTDSQFIYIKYVCSAANATPTSSSSSTSGNITTTKTVYGGLKNTVSVKTTKDDDYGDDSVTTKITLEETEEGTEVVDKEAEFSKDNNTLTYSVLINPDATTYTYTDTDGNEAAYDALTVTDTLTYYSYPMYGEVRDVNLISGSLKLYYATVDEDGTVTKISEVDTSDYTWKSAVDVTKSSWQYYYEKTLTLTVPNGATLLLEYQYLVTITITDNATWADYRANVTNTATLSADGEEIYSTTPITNNEEVADSQTSGSVTSGASYTVYKVDRDNYSITLSGAVFTLYVYDADTGEFTAAGTVTTNSSGTANIKGTLARVDNVMYYSVTLNEGTAYIPRDTICYLRETTAPDGYKVNGVNYYFYFGSTNSVLESECAGYDAETMESAENILSGYTNYVPNSRTSEYYANKTSLAATKTWLDKDGDSYTNTDGSVSFDLYRVLILNDGTVTSTAVQEGTVEEDDTSGKVEFTWTIKDTSGVSSSGSISVAASAEEPATVTLSFYSGGLAYYPDWYWYPTVILYKGSDSSGTVLATFGENWDAEFQTYDSAVVTNGWVDYTASTYNFTIVLTEDLEVYCNTGDVTSDSYYGGVDAFTSGCSATVSNNLSVTAPGATTSTVYSANFSGLYPTSTIDYATAHPLNAEKMEDGGTNYYTVTGSLNATGATVSRDVVGTDDDLDVALTLNTSSSIAFTTAEEGTLYLVLTDAKNSGTVGISLDGTTVTATATGETGSDGNAIYQVVQRLSAGAHTIKGLTDTGNLLYYIEYMPDDYNGNTWASNAEESALGSLTKATQQEISKYAEKVGTYTLSAANDWSWYAANLTTEYLDTDTYEVLGYYLYYVVESDGDYTTTYLNDSGVSTGTIGIRNTTTQSTSYELPSSGGAGTGRFYAVGGLLLGLSAALIIKRRRIWLE